MASIPHVQPGDVMRASVINALIDRVNSLEAGSGLGTAVPNLVGRTVGQALSLLNQPSAGLRVGLAIDVFGNVVNAGVAATATRLVLMQSPPVGARVTAGSAVDLIIAGQGTGTSPAPPAPTITRIETVTGTPTTTVRVGDTVAVVGTHFSAVASQNTVTFDGVPARSVVSDPSDPARRLLVGVPADIPQGPVKPGDPDKGAVVLALSTGGTRVTTTITVQAPPGQPQPAITGFTPAAQQVGKDVTINGANFSTTPSRNLVRFGTVNAEAVVSATASQIVAKVPNFTDLPATSGSTKSVQISVTVLDASGSPIGTAAASPPLIALR